MGVSLAPRPSYTEFRNPPAPELRKVSPDLRISFIDISPMPYLMDCDNPIIAIDSIENSPSANFQFT